ncbi:glycosyltransferase family 4 protein [Cyclobacterium plantarum]|uniref:Glycosyltransferase family 4 protein n=1 Tax=Cyclobacterium plantarum TaxID=2716263 RepID=A0ABX0HDE1_9BACT|nr:glycosyltransferase family 4 protein [Cyclobacterium plantarum]NHE59335.1 glycosyltransferase family 4 protein [Cyclobacterium plantarum]
MNVLILIKTSSILFDERLKKEINSLLQMDVNSITAYVLEDVKSNVFIDKVVFKNLYNFSKLSNNLFFRFFSIFYLLVYKLFFIRDSRYSLVWVHDPIMMFVIPFLSNSKVIWDLHELPPQIVFKNKVLKRIFNYALKKSSKVIVANQSRGELMKTEFSIHDYLVLENYPSNSNHKSLLSYRDDSFENWSHVDFFAYCQSATHPSRSFGSLAQACVDAKMPLLVVGEKNEVFKNVRSSVIGFDEYILVLGKKPSSVLPYYLSKSKFSFVFYTNRNLNNFYCAPNRLYHSLNYGLPVIVGKNPTMATVVERHECGIVVDSFGENSRDIEVAIRRLKEDYKFYKKHAMELKDRFVWESQIDVIRKILMA